MVRAVERTLRCSSRTLGRVWRERYVRRRASVPCAVTAAVLAGLALTGCGGDSTEPSDALPDDPPASSTRDAAYDPPDGEVVFDLRVRARDRGPAVEAYAAWQRASTTALRQRRMTPDVEKRAADGPTEIVEQSLRTVRDNDYIVPRRMVGRVESVRANRRNGRRLGDLAVPAEHI